eukprot:1458564-Lingulodinium_polyedra.AAC.1
MRGAQTVFHRSIDHIVIALIVALEEHRTSQRRVVREHCRAKGSMNMASAQFEQSTNIACAAH